MEVDNKNIIDKPLMSTIQWITLCGGLVIGTNAVNIVLADIDKVETRQDTQDALHKKDVEILLHKMSAKGGRYEENSTAIWNEINKLKENINNNQD